jgi:DUF4097 and DUF4098 domain-containing protein YvlB
MKRASIVGPLLLILVGGLFLLNNLRPDLPLIEMLARYWPLLLIAWGVLRLAEIAIWTAGSKTLPRAGISGGEWTLIAILCLAASGFFVAHRHFARWPRGNITLRGVELFGDTYDYTVAERKQAAPKAVRLLIDNIRGNARVTGADIGEVRVSGRRTVRAMRQAAADEADKLSEVEVITQGDQVIIRTNQERASSEVRVSTDLEITVPREASVEGRGRYGDFDITGVAGAVEINSDNAGVRLQNIGGIVRLDLRKSDIVRAVNVKGAVELRGGRGQDVEMENIGGQVTVNGSYSGELQFRNLAKPLVFDSRNTNFRFEKVAGQVRMGLRDLSASNVSGPIHLMSKLKDVQIADFSQTLEIRLDRGDVELRPGKAPLGKMEVETSSGNIDLAIPPAAKFDLKATSDRGSVETPMARR